MLYSCTLMETVGVKVLIEGWSGVQQDYRGNGEGSVGRVAISASISAGVGLTVLSLGASWLVHRRRRRRAAAAAAAEAADNDGRDVNSTDNAAFATGELFLFWLLADRTNCRAQYDTLYTVQYCDRLSSCLCLSVTTDRVSRSVCRF